MSEIFTNPGFPERKPIDETVDKLMAVSNRRMRPIFADQLRRLGMTDEDQIAEMVRQVYGEPTEFEASLTDSSTVETRRIMGVPEEDVYPPEEDFRRRSIRRAFGFPEPELDLSDEDFSRRGIRRAFGFSEEELDLSDEEFSRRQIGRAFGLSEEELDLSPGQLLERRMQRGFGLGQENQ